MKWVERAVEFLWVSYIAVVKISSIPVIMIWAWFLWVHHVASRVVEEFDNTNVFGQEQ